jgi:23S rRNA (uracil1939-C5)-methyltransferase
LRVNLESLVHGGEALGRTDGLVSFVDGGIPGETVEMAVRERRRSYVRGDVTQVLKASPDRVTPPCPYFGSCGGCQWQHMAYPAQLRAKRDILCDQLRRQGTQIEPAAVAVHGMAEPWRYRIRGQFHVLRRGGTVSLGFYQRRTYRTLALEDCLIHDDRIVTALPAFGRAIAAVGSGVRGLQLTVSPSRAELLWLGLPPGSAPAEVGARAGAELPALHVTDDSIGIEDDGRQFRLRNETFVQVNAQQMPRLYGLVVDALALQGSERVVDAYAGIGVLSARLAARAGEVWCLEEHPVAVRLGELNARVNGQANLRYLRGQVEKTLSQVPAPCHAVVLDPPRAGCDGAALDALLRLRPARIVYISCDPASLARDLRRLHLGYTIEQLSVVDMFPQTYHVESVASLVARR